MAFEVAFFQITLYEILMQINHDAGHLNLKSGGTLLKIRPESMTVILPLYFLVNNEE